MFILNLILLIYAAFSYGYMFAIAVMYDNHDLSVRIVAAILAPIIFPIKLFFTFVIKSK